MCSRVVLSALAGLLCSVQVFALNIVVANDDSFETANVQRLRLALLKEGHSVLLSLPCAHQSGKGGALGSLLTPVPVRALRADAEGVLRIDDEVEVPDGYCVGDTEADKATKTFKDYKDGTPLQASSHGLFKARQLWGRDPDLLISGPNEGRNVGFAVFMSGTLGAAHNAIVNGVPAIAISAGLTPKEAADAVRHADLVADVTLTVIKALQSSAGEGKALLPPKTGLNINTPDFERLADAPVKFTRVNWNFGNAIEWANLGAPHSAGQHYGMSEASGLFGMNVFPGADRSGDTAPDSEGNATEAGFIAISVIDATENADEASETAVRARLGSLR